VLQTVGNKVGQGFNRVCKLVKDEVLYKSNPYGKHKKIAPSKNDHANKENAVFIGMKKYSKMFIMGSIHKMKKVFDVEIPPRTPHIVNKVIDIHQNTRKETNEGIQEGFKKEVKDYTESQ
jgi:hypothetical protein